MSFFEFPHSRTYDSDLYWLIKTVKEISESYDSFKEYVSNWINSHDQDYTQLLQRVDSIENELDTFEETINQRFEELRNSLDEYIYQQVHDALDQIIADVTDVRVQIQELRNDVTRQLLELNASISAHDMMTRNWVEARLQQFINEIPDLTTINVWNPVKGTITSVQMAINDLYSLLRYDSLTAEEYDLMELTAQEYDDFQMSAFDYDNYAKNIFGRFGVYKNPLFYMNSPFTGEYVPITTVINELAFLHRSDALTASEYDVKELTADDYDTLQLTAYQYDWSGKILIV